MMDKEKGDLKELGLAITLLAGISAVLFKIVDYFSNNIIDLNLFAIVLVYILVGFLIIEIFMVLLFFSVTGFLSVQEKKLERLEKLNGTLQKVVFSVPTFVLIYSFSMIFYFGPIKVWNNPYIAMLCFLGFWFIMIILSFYIFRDLKLLFLLIILLIFVAILFPITTLLLSGTYSIEIIHPSGSNKDIMPIAIKDTGLLRCVCVIDLCKVNKSNKNLFSSIDNITFYGSEKNSSTYMTGKKEDGIYYLFINTSNTDLSSNYYFLQAEGTYIFYLLKVRKSDNKLFYLPPKNKTVTALNQTSIL